MKRGVIVSTLIFQSSPRSLPEVQVHQSKHTKTNYFTVSSRTALKILITWKMHSFSDGHLWSCFCTKGVMARCCVKLYFNVLLLWHGEVINALIYVVKLATYFRHYVIYFSCRIRWVTSWSLSLLPGNSTLMTRHCIWQEIVEHIINLLFLRSCFCTDKTQHILFVFDRFDLWTESAAPPRVPTLSAELS